MSVADLKSRDLTGQVVLMREVAGRTWFHALATERVKDDVYRFDVIQFAGKSVDMEIVASIEQLAAAAVA